MSFDIAAVDDVLFNGNQEILLTVVCGDSTETSTITVYDNETATLTVELPLTVTELKFLKNDHAAILSSTDTRELSLDLCGSGQTKLKSSSVEAFAINRRTSEKAK